MEETAAAPPVLLTSTGRIVPGLVLCVVLALAAVLGQAMETRVAGRAWIEALVLAILLGAIVRSLRPGVAGSSSVFVPGIRWSAGTLLEIAVALLGASLDLGLILRAGPALLAAVVITVSVGLSGSYALGRAFGLGRKLAVLVACGNAICGNSAIAAIAPVIGAESEDVASSIAFTAALGVVVVLSLPALIQLLGLTTFQYGVLAGLTVYAVPQVIAATLPVSAVSGQIGTFVKLIRVLMLGPVALVLSIRSQGRLALTRAGMRRLVPWFILGFLVMAVLRGVGLIPVPLAEQAHQAATAFATVSMAALGLGVDVRALGRVGARVTATVSLSLLMLIALSLGLIRVLAIG
jgi:uncharacterized integral membrane protein (TIGR00698 family)